MAESDIAVAQAATNLALTTLRDAMQAKKQALINGATSTGTTSANSKGTTANSKGANASTSASANSNSSGAAAGSTDDGNAAGTSVPLEKRPARKPRGRHNTQPALPYQFS